MEVLPLETPVLKIAALFPGRIDISMSHHMCKWQTDEIFSRKLRWGLDLQILEFCYGHYQICAL